MSTTKIETILTAKKRLTMNQVKALHTTPIEIIPAPGAGKAISIIDFVAKLNFNTAAFDNTDTLIAGATSKLPVGQMTISGLLQATASKYSKYTSIGNAINGITVNEGISVIAGGDGTVGDGSVDIFITYNLLDV